ncbi:MAG: NusA-like transcription termination signal-binding factor [Nanoarchaeota archaeon]|nr:NusA-like transcription termination signal-binding factor [Nanoarchaeota archaeon]
MIKIKYDMAVMKYISLFETVTRTKVKDCISDNNLLFVVEPGYLSRAIGKGGVNVRKLEGILKKKIRIIEFNPDVKLFVKNLLYPINVESIEEEDNVIIIKDSSTKTKGMIIGRDSQNLNFYKSIAGRYFDIKDIIVR